MGPWLKFPFGFLSHGGESYVKSVLQRILLCTGALTALFSLSHAPASAPSAPAVSALPTGLCGAVFRPPLLLFLLFLCLLAQIWDVCCAESGHLRLPTSAIHTDGLS